MQMYLIAHRKKRTEDGYPSTFLCSVIQLRSQPLAIKYRA